MRRSHKKRFKLKYVIVLSVYAIVAPLLVATSAVLYVRDYNNNLSNMENLYNNLVQVADQNISAQQAELKDIAVYMSVNKDVLRILSMSKADMEAEPLVWRDSPSCTFIRDMVYIKGYIHTLILYPENGAEIPFYISSLSSLNTVIKKNINEIRDLDLYKKAIEVNGDFVWSRISGSAGLYESNRDDKIILAKEIYDLSKQNKYGFLAIGIDANQFAQACAGLLQHDHEGILVQTADRDTLAQVGNVAPDVLAYINTDGFLSRFGQKQYTEVGNYFVFSNMPTGNSVAIYYIVPKEVWLNGIYSAYVLPSILAVSLLICLWPLTILMSGVISKPLRRLYDSMIEFKNGDFSQRLQVKGSEEIAELTEGFNQMVEDIKKLIDKNYVMVLRERQSELDALQAQINPHFLYNTLDSLYWEAFDSEQFALSEDILAFSKLFRLVLNHGEGETPLSSEVELVSHYLHIQKRRFGKKLGYDIAMEEDILDTVIPKLIIQPFVENAIVHGLERQSEAGYISVKGYKEGGLLVVQVKDNGVGMSEEQVREILSSQSEPQYSSQRIGRYAIKNVNERLSLKYNDAFRLEITSQPGEGTLVTIEIPFMEGYEHG